MDLKQFTKAIEEIILIEDGFSERLQVRETYGEGITVITEHSHRPLGEVYPERVNSLTIRNNLRSEEELAAVELMKEFAATELDNRYSKITQATP